MRSLGALLLALFLAVPQALGALPIDEPRFSHLSVADGLPDNTILALLQDHQGFVWLGTQNGLVRYDGYDMVMFKPDPADPFSLPGRHIYALHEDASGTLWVGTQDAGLARYDRATRRFKHFRHDPANPEGLPNDWVYTIYEAPSNPGVLWLGTNGGGLVRFDPNTETFETFRHDPDDPYSLPDDDVHRVFEDTNGLLWVGTHAGGLSRLDCHSGLFTHYQHDPEDPTSLPSDDVNAIFASADGTLWVGTAGGLGRWNADKETFDRFQHDPSDPRSLSDNNILSLLEDSQGRFWVGVSGYDMRPGLNLFDPERGTFDHIGYDPRSASGMVGSKVGALLEDQAGQLWIGTLYSGVNRMDLRPPRFPWYTQDPAAPAAAHSYGGLEVSAFHEDQSGALWIGSWGQGLDRFDPTAGTFTHYRHDTQKPGSLPADEVTAVYETPEGTLWVGLWQTWARRDASTGQFEEITAQGQPEAPIYTISGRAAGGLWVGTGQGLYHYDPIANLMTAELLGPSIKQLIEAPDGLVYQLSHEGEVTQYNPETGIQVDIGMAEEEGVRVNMIMLDAAGELWMGTRMHGFCRFTPDGTHLRLTAKEGLSHDTVLGVLEDPSGALWVSTPQGLARWQRGQEAWRRYDLREEGPGTQMLSKAHRGRSGRIYFGGVGGFLAFDPDAVDDAANTPPVALTDFRLFTESVAVGPDAPLQQDITVAEEIRLKHWQNDVSFGFVGLSYEGRDKIRYAYRLEAYDADWRTAGEARTATYTNLEPGTYTFRAAAANADGVWNEQTANIELTIAPPWWKTPAAYFLFLLLTAAAVYAFVQWRLFALQRQRIALEDMVTRRTAEVVKQKELVERAKATIEAQAGQLQTLDRMKSRFFANISHEFRTPLTLILGPIDDARKGRFGILPPTLGSQFEMMQRHGERLLVLINQLLDLSKVESGNMVLDRQGGELGQFVRAQAEAFQSLATRRQITLSLDIPEEPLWTAFDRDKLEKIINNLLSNALKFTAAGGEVSLRLTLEGPAGMPSAAVLQVEDNGRGIPPAALPHIFDRFHQVDPSSTRREGGTGIGLALVRELVVLHEGRITVRSAPGQGSCFTVWLPLPNLDATQPPTRASNDVPSTFWGDGRGDGHLSIEPNIPMPAPSVQDGLRAADPPPKQSAANLVLIVEDDPDVRAYLRSHLTPRYQVAEAADGEEGLVQAQAKRPALIISDIMMPRMNGLDFCAALRADPELGDIPIILLTARASTEGKVEGLEQGADDYLYKPFKAEELLCRVENLIELRQRLRQRYRREVIAVAPADVSVSSADEAFLAAVQSAVEAQMGDPQFGVDWLADTLHLSARQLRRKIKALTGLSAAGYIRSMRLQRAAQLLEQQAGTVAEVAYAVGFKDTRHFARLFRQVFGIAPSSVARGD